MGAMLSLQMIGNRKTSSIRLLPETEMLITVDLKCWRCDEKIRKIIRQFHREIRNQVYDERKNLVWITVLSCSPEKIRDKIICKGGGMALSVEIVPPEPNEPENPPVRPLSREDSSDGNDEKEVCENPPVRPLNREDSSDGDDEKIRRERTSPREDDSDTFLSICDEDEESGTEVDVGNTLSANILEPVRNVFPNGSFRRRITSWKKGKRLGSGSFGTVYKGVDNHNGFFFAIKEISLLDPGSRGEERLSRLQQEISLLSRFDHENIVRYLGSNKDDTNLYLFLELMTEGSLKTLYGKCVLTESQVSTYTRQILNGLKCLHDQKVVHRDIKCANILVDASGSVKLADFGLAKAIEMNSAKTFIGSAYWMAPEVIDPKRTSYGLEADIWSLGGTVLEMFTRQHPYPGLEPHAALFRIGKGEPPQVPDSLSRDTRNFILGCLKINPEDRPTAAELLDHPFVRN